jgi:hypothetical protein
MSNFEVKERRQEDDQRGIGRAGKKAWKGEETADLVFGHYEVNALRAGWVTGDSVPLVITQA